MIAIDTNILVYAHRPDSPHHELARRALTKAMNGPVTVGVPWPVAHEFLAIVTHPRVYKDPASPAEALAAVEALRQAGVIMLAEGADHLTVLTELLQTGNAIGPRVHDARIAAICLSHGVDALWSADRDFTWFPRLRVVNPLIPPR